MCLALVALDAHPRFPLVVAANRDEHHARATAAARWWDEGWLGGRDLTAGGTWLGVTRAGRFAFVTNVREPGRNDVAAPSRGTLVTHALATFETPLATVESALRDGGAYNGFNLIAGDAAQRVLGLESGAGRGFARRGRPWSVECGARYRVAEGDADAFRVRRVVRSR